ncbi:MAG: nucleotidyl transferase AbiEii/AbiGii toxin family protein [Acidobacteria bacterium]|nr:nucleotidyl transferase AbiEii/AbiGii toxin family protein [Acidobacteriota bacterium]
MGKREIKDVASSVRARLTNLARERREELQSVLTRYGGERFLYRLSISEHRDRFFLKGATLFSLWFDTPHRPTRDLDLLGFGPNTISDVEDTVRSICSIKVNDGLDFSEFRAEPIRREEAYGGIRVKFSAKLGQAKISLQVDIGFGDAVTPGPAMIDFPTLLDLPAPRLKTYPKETVIAEKFEAMVKLGEANGRMKDFWDLNYLITECEFSGILVQSAIRATFRNRRNVPPVDVPIALTDQFFSNPNVAARWTGFINRNRIERSRDFSQVIGNLRIFFEPIIAHEANQARFEQNWSSISGWK